MAQVAEQFGAPRADLPHRIARLLDRLKAADRESARLKQRATAARADTATDVNGVRTVTTTTAGNTQEARALALAVNTAAREAGLLASALVKQVLGGRGGGSAEVAQGGGFRPDGIAAALTSLPTVIATH